MSALSAFRLDGCVFVITGAGTGIGRATALAAAELGAASLILTGRRIEKLSDTAHVIANSAPHCRVTTVASDMTLPTGRSSVVAAVKASGGKLTGLVNNAGYISTAALEATTDSEWQRHLDVNLTAPFALTRDLLPFLKSVSMAAVVNVSSTLADKPIPNASAYNAAKAGLVQLTRTLALELGPHQIRVNAVLPAIVETPMYRSRFADDAAAAVGMLEAAKLHPLGRAGQPQDIALAIAFLLSPASSWITGVALPVDGGMLCT